MSDGFDILIALKNTVGKTHGPCNDYLILYILLSCVIKLWLKVGENLEIKKCVILIW